MLFSFCCLTLLKDLGAFGAQCRRMKKSSRWHKYTRDFYNPFLIGVLLCLIHLKDCNSNLVQIVKVLLLLYAYISQNFILIGCVSLLDLFYALLLLLSYKLDSVIDQRENQNIFCPC